VLNVGGLRHETYKTTLKIGRVAAGRSTQRRYNQTHVVSETPSVGWYSNHAEEDPGDEAVASHRGARQLRPTDRQTDRQTHATDH